MRAVILEEVKGPQGLVFKEDIEEPHPRRNEVRVRILFAALNHRDLWITLGQYAGVRVPQILGSDGVGIVDAVGKGMDRFLLNKTVIINPSLHWGENVQVQGEKYEILGLPRQGTLAEYCCVPAENVMLKPSFLNMEEAAALPLAGLTAYRALFTQGRLKPGEKVLVTGIGGGVALFALQLALAYGARVWVTSSSPEKIERARKLGARGGFLYTEAGYSEYIRKKLRGVDLIIDGAGGEGFSELLNALAPGGRIVTYGATRGNPSRLDLRRIFWRQLKILGSTMGTAQEFKKMVKFVTRKRIHPVIDEIVPLTLAREAFTRMLEGKQFGKIVLDVRT